MIVRLEKWTATIVISALMAGVAAAQTSPSPGPTAPSQPSLPIPKKGDDLVINPTQEECMRGWHSGLRWSKAQFDQLCAQLKISK